MIKIDAKLDEKQTSEKKEIFVTCPVCGQKLTDVKIIHGSVLFRTVCRRCRNFISVRIEE